MRFSCFFTGVQILVWSLLAGTVLAQEIIVDDEEDSTEGQLVIPPVEEKPSTHVNLLGLAYSMGQTLGTTQDFVDDYSFSGVSLEYRFRPIKPFSVGARLRWQMFAEKERGKFEYDQYSMTVTGTRINSLKVLPLCATAHYYLPFDRVLLPFVGVELGAYYVTSRSDHGWWALVGESWHFGFGPELGAILTVGFPLLVSAQFNYLVKTSDAPEELYLTFNVGIALAQID